MTDQTRFRAALCVSLFLHFMLLHAHWGNVSTRSGRGERFTQEITSSSALFSETISVAIESIADTTQQGEGADKRLRDRRAYLEAVSDAIHARRFIASGADSSLIGLAWFSFTIMPDGSFHSIALTNSSGIPALDRTAEVALRSASGVVRRPPSLGDEKIDLTMAVKYQYDW